MTIIARAGSDWEMPTEGLHGAVCCDVVDNGMVETQWGSRHEVQLRWQLDEPTSEDKPMLISRKFTLSLGEKSALRPFLESWRGKKFTAEELEGFDLERLLGVNGQLQVLYNERDGKTFANVQALFPQVKGVEAMVVRDYIRAREREIETLASDGYVPPKETDPEDVPFSHEPKAAWPTTRQVSDYQAAFEGVATKLEFAKLLGEVNKRPAEERESIVPYIKAARARLEATV